MVQPDEQSFQVIFAGLVNFIPLDMDMLDQDFFLPHQAGQIKSQRHDIGFQFRACFLERHEDARLAELDRAAHEKLDRKQGLAATGAAADQRGPAAGQAATRDFVETLDARGALRQKGGRGCKLVPVIFHGRAHPLTDSRETRYNTYGVVTHLTE